MILIPEAFLFMYFLTGILSRNSKNEIDFCENNFGLLIFGQA